jgi:L-fuconolactonase
LFDAEYSRRNFPQPRADWLARHSEPALEPSLSIVDAHHHFWEVHGMPYLRNELAADMAGSGHHVVATVAIECKARYRTEVAEALGPVGETVWLAADAAPASAIVGWADLRLGDAVLQVLEAHIEAGRGYFRGVRLRAAWHEDPALHPSTEGQSGLLLEASVWRAVRQLARLGLTLDVWAFHTQLAEVAKLAAAAPEARIVLNHCGGPLGIGPFAGKRNEVFADWQSRMLELSSYPNLSVKLGGLGMPRIGFPFAQGELPPTSQVLAKAWAPYVETCIEAFGAERCMFESNFPVDKGMCSYGVLWNAFKRIAYAYSANEKAALFSGTASAHYGLETSNRKTTT